MILLLIFIVGADDEVTETELKTEFEVITF